MLRPNTQRTVRIHVLLLLLMLLCSIPAVGQAQETTVGFGTDLGFWTGTTDGTDFTIAFHFDYYFDPAFSIGPLLLFTPTSDLTQVAFAPVARFHLQLARLNIVPFAGVGLIHSSLDRSQGAGRIDRSDTGFYIPLGVTAEYPISPKISLATTLLVNLHDIELGAPVEGDRTSIAVLFGFRFGP